MENNGCWKPVRWFQNGQAISKPLLGFEMATRFIWPF